MKNCRIAELPNCRIEKVPKGRLDLAQHEVPSPRAEDSPVPQGRLECVRAGLRLLRSALAEIFDENAYARFLSRHELAPSRASYLAFLQENSAASERRPRCC